MTLDNQAVRDSHLDKFLDHPEIKRHYPNSVEYIRQIREENKGLLDQFRVLSETCCSGCEYDEAEGGLFRHCDKCMEKIVSALYAKTHGLEEPRGD